MHSTKRNFFLMILFALVFIFSGCAAPQTNQGKGTMWGTGLGAAAGAGLGQAIGGNSESTLLGAGIGALVGGFAGNKIGAYMDAQEDQLRQVAAQSQALAIQRENNVLRATFKSEYMFATNSSQLQPGALPEIIRVANVLNQYPQTQIMVEGHTDKTGPENYNLTLSKQRADAVANALVSQGVAPSRITTMGFGESQPISSNDAINRRVELKITPLQSTASF